MLPSTDRLIEGIELDILPSFAAMVDFGIDRGDPSEKFGALQWAYRRELVTAKELNKALGCGEALTEIASRVSPIYGPNPYACIFVTAYDLMALEGEEY